jgi:hypothetical protein
MPIAKQFRQFYGREWRTVTRPRILDRAGNCCEHCKKPDRAIVETITGKAHPAGYFMFWRFPDCVKQPANATGIGGDWKNHEGGRDVAGFTFKSRMWKEPRDIVVVLTVAHLNHQAGDDRDENLKALCQWCHLVHDLEHHHGTRAARKDAGRDLLRLLDVENAKTA